MKTRKWLLKESLGIIVILTIIGGIWWIVHPRKPDPECFAREDVLITINGTLLAIPREYNPIFHTPERKNIEFADKRSMLKVCQRLNDSPIEVAYLTFSDNAQHGLSYSIIQPLKSSSPRESNFDIKENKKINNFPRIILSHKNIEIKVQYKKNSDIFSPKERQKIIRDEIDRMNARAKFALGMNELIYQLEQ